MKFAKIRFVILLITMLLGIVITFVMRTQASQSKYNNYAAPQAGYSILLTPSPTRPVSCVALPGTGETLAERTPTPQRGQGKKVPTQPLPTQPPVIQIYDFSPLVTS